MNTSKVAVRIFPLASGKWLVQGRKTSVVCTSFDDAWQESIPYFAGRKR